MYNIRDILIIAHKSLKTYVPENAVPHDWLCDRDRRDHRRID